MDTKLRSNVINHFMDILMGQGLKIRATTRPDYAAELAETYVRRDGSPVTVIANEGKPHLNQVVLTGTKIPGEIGLQALLEQQGFKIQRNSVQTDVKSIVIDLLNRGAYEVRLYNIGTIHSEYGPELVIATKGVTGQ